MSGLNLGHAHATLCVISLLDSEVIRSLDYEILVQCHSSFSFDKTMKSQLFLFDDYFFRDLCSEFSKCWRFVKVVFFCDGLNFERMLVDF